MAGVQGFYEVIEAAFPDLQIICTGEYDVPGTSIRELTLRGTQTGDYLGVPASGNPVSVEVAILYIFGEGADAGKLVAERVYFDNDVLLRQCRGELPPVGLGLAPPGG